jgi:hypothetical protein
MVWCALQDASFKQTLSIDDWQKKLDTAEMKAEILLEDAKVSTNPQPSTLNPQPSNPNPLLEKTQCMYCDSMDHTTGEHGCNYGRKVRLASR